MLILEFGGAFPWVRRHRCAPTLQAAQTPVETPPHRSWVQTDEGIGWLDHHGPSGYFVRLQDGRLIQRTADQFTHVEAPR